MTIKTEITAWLNYWVEADMVDLDQIRAFEHVAQARKYCRCMRVGVFHPDIVSDLSIWNALRALRSAKAA